MDRASGLFISRTLAKSFGGQLNFVPWNKGADSTSSCLKKREQE